MFGLISRIFISRAEDRLGVEFPYVRQIANTKTRLLLRYRHFLSFLGPNQDLPAEAYHLARLRGALAAGCNSCLEAEVAMARSAGLRDPLIRDFLMATPEELPAPLGDVMRLSDAVVRDRVDAPEARDAVRAAFGEEGLIELSYAMNGAALLTGLSRALGHATPLDLDFMGPIARKETR